MSKLKEIEITTKTVYLNIIRKNETETMTLPTGEAVEKYGELEVAEVSEPVYQEETAGGKKRKEEDASTLKAGVTNIMLTEEEANYE